jgi:type IV secretory pathway TraG/TraD family ATPase VirD4
VGGIVDTILRTLLIDLKDIALPVALVASGLSLILPFVYVILRGQQIKRSAGFGKDWSFVQQATLVLLVASFPAAIFGWYGVIGSHFLIDYGNVDEKKALFGLAMAGMLTITGGIFTTYAIRPGSVLSDRVNLFFGGVRRRGDELGSAHFCDRREYKRFNNIEADGLTLLGEFRGEESGKGRYRILGDTFSLSPEDAARGIITIGNPGSGKSSSIILPVIVDSMREGGSLVVADPQGELTPEVIKYAAFTGHLVIVHDPTNEMAARYNLADGVSDVTTAQSIADVLVPSSGKGGDFFELSAKALLAACLMVYDNIGTINQRFGDMDQLVKDFDALDENNDAKGLAGDFINAAKTSPRQASGVLSTASRKLDAWSAKKIRDSTAVSDFKPSILMKKPAVIVIACPGKERRALAPYIGAALTRLLLDLDTIGEKQPGGALPKPVKFILDEFPAMGDLRVIVEQANLVRKRRISFLLAAQTIGQLQEIYGRDGTATLLAGMATNIIFGGADKETAQYYSGLAGNKTKATGDDGRVSERPLLTHDQIISPPHAPQGNVIIFTRYVTASYAVHAVILARLTRIYERRDIQNKIAASENKNRRARVFTRKHAQRRRKKKRQTIQPEVMPEVVPEVQQVDTPPPITAAPEIDIAQPPPTVIIPICRPLITREEWEAHSR